MQNNYIIRQSNDRLINFFSFKENSIFYKTYENDKWSEATVVLPNTLDNFTVTLSQDGTIYIFCQNLFGDIVLCTCNKNLSNWSNKILLKNQSNKIHTILFYPIIKSNGLCIIYNVPSDNGSSQLISQNVNSAGEWSKPKFIDNLLGLNSNMFQVQNISSEHLIVFYQSKRNENNIGYREIALSRFSDFKPIHLTSYQIVDTSFITTNNAIHALYAVKSMFSYQILYRKKTGDSFDKPVIIWEGQKVDNCLLSIVNSIIYATFKYRGQLFICSSTNQGTTFSKPEIYRNKISTNLKKCIYISENFMDEKKFFVKELYVDKNDTSNIQMLPQLYEMFYKNIDTKSPIENVELNVGKEATVLDTNSTKNVDIIKKLKKDIIDKEEQIVYMTEIINKYKLEKEELEFNRINIEEKHSKDLDTLNNKILQLEKFNKSLNDKVSNLEYLNASINDKITEFEQLNTTLINKNTSIEKINESLLNEVMNLEKVSSFLNEKISQLEEIKETTETQENHDKIDDI